MFELIDRFEPDFLYSDGSLPFGRHWANKPQKCEDDRAYDVGLEAVAHLYNRSIEKYGENRALYLQKNRGPEIYRVGVLDMERSVLDEASPNPWNTDTCIGSWFYDTRVCYKKPSLILEMLVDIVAKNGCLLLNIPQRPDGTIDDEEEYILGELGGWFRLNGCGIYASRPWRVALEGDTRPASGKEEQTNWTERDVRYVHIIYQLLKVKGYTLAGAKIALKERFSDYEERIILLETLDKTRKFLLDLDKSLAERQKSKAL